MSLIINFVFAGTVFASGINAFFAGGKEKQLLASSLCCLVARIPVFLTGFSDPMLRQGVRTSLHATTHCCLEPRSELFQNFKNYNFSQ